MTPWVLGISASAHNGAVCLVHGDEIVVAIQEERLTRRKRAGLYAALPSFAVDYCLGTAGIRPCDLNAVVICSVLKPSAAGRLIHHHPMLQGLTRSAKIFNITHHLGHAVAAFATSGFDRAAVVVIDGAGSEYEELDEDEKRVIVSSGGSHETISIYEGDCAGLRPKEKHIGFWLQGDSLASWEVTYGSIGGLYSAAANHIFSHRSALATESGALDGPGKLMGLAPFGTPNVPPGTFYQIRDNEFIFGDMGWLRSRKGGEGWPAHAGAHANLAASVQRATEEAVLHVVRRARSLVDRDKLCYAGGVALNSVANERVVRESAFSETFIMPAAEDSGPAIGACFFGLWKLTKKFRTRRLVHDSVGRPYSVGEVDESIERTPGIRRFPAGEGVVATAASLLKQGRIVGWLQGGSELGPRALGQRSILCDPSISGIKDVVNSRVKHREAFRPFAPAILLEKCPDWFEVEGSAAESPAMLRVMRFRRDMAMRVPAVVHVDGTGRVQTLTQAANGRFWELVRAFENQTGLPLLLNTSFNVAGEPIVESPSDALWCLLYTGLDVCILEDRIVSKAANFRSVLDLPMKKNGRYITGPSAGEPRGTPSGKIAPSLVFTLAVDREKRMLDYVVAASPPGTVKYLTDTQWGMTLVSVEPELANLLELFEGGCTGRSVLEAVARRIGYTEESFTRAVGLLKRGNLLTF